MLLKPAHQRAAGQAERSGRLGFVAVRRGQGPDEAFAFQAVALRAFRGQGLTGALAVTVTGPGVTATLQKVVDDGTLAVQLSVVDAAPYSSDWDPTEPGGPLKPPRRPPPEHTLVALGLTVTAADGTVLDARALGLDLTLDAVDNNP